MTGPSLSMRELGESAIVLAGTLEPDSGAGRARVRTGPDTTVVLPDRDRPVLGTGAGHLLTPCPRRALATYRAALRILRRPGEAEPLTGTRVVPRP